MIRKSAGDEVEGGATGEDERVDETDQEEAEGSVAIAEVACGSAVDERVHEHQQG